MKSRWIVCPIHDMPMRIIRLHESEEDANDVEWIFWQCLEGECTRVVIEMNPGMPLSTEAFIVPETKHRDDL